MSNLPENLNDYNAWVDRGNIKEALDALKNQVAGMVADEPTKRLVAFREFGQQQEQRDAQLAATMERIVFGFRDDLLRFRGELREEMINRFDAYGEELDRYREDHRALRTLVEERLAGPFGEVVQRVETLEYGYADLADKLDAALDPSTPGATIGMVVLQDRVTTLTRLILAMFVVILVLGALLLWHHYYIWARLGSV